MGLKSQTKTLTNYIDIMARESNTWRVYVTEKDQMTPALTLPQEREQEKQQILLYNPIYDGICCFSISQNQVGIYCILYKESATYYRRGNCILV